MYVCAAMPSEILNNDTDDIIFITMLGTGLYGRNQSRAGEEM